MKPLPKLVSDTKLETHFEGEGITSHLYRNPDPTSRHQVIHTQVKWKRQEFIDQGGFATVWRETRVGEDSYNRYFVQSLGWYEDTSRHLHIAMEYLPRGDMRQYLSKSPSLPETGVQQVICQVLEGLSLMHDYKFAHRDLKSGNILICSSPPEPWWVKIAGFGLTKRAEETTAGPSAPMGTSGYMAPELLDFLPGADKSSNKVAFPADMWALGEITFRMLAGRPVFDGLFP
ncbi:kinase-like protein [Corynespora cassiicola Philippines]|uniref:Kinase-like protein n=1 Tax=Corynespora cassiicola Philippines TaxID=1448308 RepID=A0A2T2N8Z6_CORCC|nr:kinase-like protein [Corynespora cassiicola Philippines]